jgi:hypothetical protein
MSISNELEINTDSYYDSGRMTSDLKYASLLGLSFATQTLYMPYVVPYVPSFLPSYFSAWDAAKMPGFASAGAVGLIAGAISTLAIRLLTESNYQMNWAAKCVIDVASMSLVLLAAPSIGISGTTAYGTTAILNCLFTRTLANPPQIIKDVINAASTKIYG